MFASFRAIKHSEMFKAQYYSAKKLKAYKLLKLVFKSRNKVISD